MEDGENRGDEKGGQGAHTLELANSSPPHLSEVGFRQLTDPNASLSQDENASTVVLRSENESRARPLTTPGGSVKRRNSDQVNREKMLQRINATSNNACALKRKESTGVYATILDFVNEGNEENEGENRNTGAQSDGGEEGSGYEENANESKKPDDPNQALLQYFAKVSSSADLHNSLDLEHIRSFLHEGASLNTSDRFGQTLLHEVARNWGVDAAQFFIEQGKAISMQSFFTEIQNKLVIPLHEVVRIG